MKEEQEQEGAVGSCVLAYRWLAGEHEQDKFPVVAGWPACKSCWSFAVTITLTFTLDFTYVF